jgi:RNase P subunit RPR2
MDLTPVDEKKARDWLERNARKKKCCGCGSGLVYEDYGKPQSQVRVAKIGQGQDLFITVICPDCAYAHFFSPTKMGITV